MDRGSRVASASVDEEFHMKRIFAKAAIALALGGVVIASAPADARPGYRGGGHGYSHGGYRGGYYHGGYGYRRGYGYHNGAGVALGAGILGLALGSALAPAPVYVDPYPGYYPPPPPPPPPPGYYGGYGYGYGY